jgi:hypothetical protein
MTEFSWVPPASELDTRNPGARENPALCGDPPLPNGVQGSHESPPEDAEGEAGPSRVRKKMLLTVRARATGQMAG